MRKIENTFEAIHSQVGGKWKLTIINELMARPMRFNQLKKHVPGISQKVLSETLKNLEAGGLINKTVYEDNVLHTEYSLTLMGGQLGRLVEQLATWYNDYNVFINQSDKNDGSSYFYIPNRILNEEYKNRIKRARKAIAEADNILVGIGTGMQVEVGIDNRSRETAEKYFPEQIKNGFQTVREMILCYGSINPDNEIAYWNFWTSYIRFTLEHNKESAILDTLKIVLNGKNYFILTTNADHTIYNCGFDEEKLLELLGSSIRLQCINGCNDVTYEAEPFVDILLSDLDKEGNIKNRNIPRCPVCGDYLVINHRENQMNWFVESQIRHKKNNYDRFVEDSLHKKTVLLEIGCRLHFPELIRLSFEQFTYNNPSFKLIRINHYDCSISNKSLNGSKRVILFNEKIHDVLKDMSE